MQKYYCDNILVPTKDAPGLAYIWPYPNPHPCPTRIRNPHLNCFIIQVSNQCMALVRDNILVPTKDAPELAYIRKPFLQNFL